MSQQIAHRLAKELLTQNIAAESFEVDFMDRKLNDAVSEALERLGCSVKRSKFKASLLVTCCKGTCRISQTVGA